MAITPPSDIVLEVARAADPEKYRLAMGRLERSRSAAQNTNEFAVPVANPPADTSYVAGPLTAAAPPATGPVARNDRRLDAYGKFEAFVLQTFVQSMLPKNAEGVFGKGSAGEFWKSMLAEGVGNELARSGQVGIARRLAAGPNHPPRPATVIEANPLAPPPSSTVLPSAGVIPAIDTSASTTAPDSEGS